MGIDGYGLLAGDLVLTVVDYETFLKAGHFLIKVSLGHGWNKKFLKLVYLYIRDEPYCRKDLDVRFIKIAYKNFPVLFFP